MQPNWPLIAQRRLRLAAITLAAGLILGVAIGLIVTAPPVWIGEVASCTH